MIVIKTLKLTTLLIAMVGILPTLAAYRIAIPLETTQGGALPNGSIIIGDGTNTGNQPTPPSTNCLYDSGTFVQMLKASNGTFESGDRVYIYNNNLIGYYSPSNGLTPPNGLSAGEQKSNDTVTVDFELCGDNLSNYPALPPVGGPPPGPIDPPVDDHTGPDWTPECILNTTTDYAAINTSNGTREFHSTTFGLTNFASPRWYYVPDNYDPDASPVSTSSYIYFDNSEQTGDSRVSGPNPNYTYSKICRVKKMEL